MSEQSLQVIERAAVGRGAVERYADVAPVISIQEAVERHQQLAKYVGSVMIEGHDFGTIPGVGKPGLLKPGAEKLTTFFGLTIPSPKCLLPTGQRVTLISFMNLTNDNRYLTRAPKLSS